MRQRMRDVGAHQVVLVVVFGCQAARDGVCLACASLAIGEYCGVVACQAIVHHWHADGCEVEEVKLQINCSRRCRTRVERLDALQLWEC